MSRILASLFFLGSLGLLAEDISAAENKTAGAKTCVAFMMNEPKHFNEVKTELAAQIKKMGYNSIDPHFSFKVGGPRVLRECLQGDYEDVILVAHTQERVEGYQTLLYHPENSANPEEYVPLDARVFSNLKIKPTLRQFTLVGCEAEKVLKNYKIIHKFTEKNGLNLKIQPEDVQAKREFEKNIWNRIQVKMGLLPRDLLDSKLRDTRLLTFTIAESMQSNDGAEGSFYCLMRSRFSGAVESIEDSCLRNRFKVKAEIKDPKRADTGADTYWIRVPTENETAPVKRSSDSPDKHHNRGLFAAPISEFDQFGVGSVSSPAK